MEEKEYKFSEESNRGLKHAIIVGFIFATILGGIFGFLLARRYPGTTVKEMGVETVTTEEIEDDTITSDDIQAGTITTEEIKDGTISLGDIGFLRKGTAHVEGSREIDTGLSEVYAFSVMSQNPSRILWGGIPWEKPGYISVYVCDLEGTSGSAWISWVAIGE